MLLLADLNSAEECYAVLDRVLAGIREPFRINGSTARVSASIGIAMSPLENPDADALLRQADQAMYRAKDEGRDCYRLFTS